MSSGRTRRASALLALLALAAASLAATGPARAHGSLPIAEEILWSGDTMMVPAAYWGLFVGTDGGPWRWICEEAINANQSRQMVLIRDGTLMATDHTGITVSRDGGCSWEAATGGIGALSIGSLAADPVRARAWALASSSDSTSNGLYTSDDAGRTWQRPYVMLDHLPTGLKLSDDGKTVVIGSVTNAMPRQAVLHISTDGGLNFVKQTLDYQLDGMALSFFVPLWIDLASSPPGRVYLAVRNDTGNVLLKLDGAGKGGTPVEVLRTPGIFNDMSRNPSGTQVLLASTKGLFASKNDGPFTQLPTLGSAQCLTIHKGTFYACAWNYAPDLAAIARLADDAASFTKVFQFNDTKEPVSCPAGTPVANICPMVWANYADQLGVNLKGGDGGMAPPSYTGGCALSPVPAAPVAGLVALAALLLLFRRTRWRPVAR